MCNVGSLLTRTPGRTVRGEVAGNADQNVLALGALSPSVALVHAGFQYLQAVEVQVFADRCKGQRIDELGQSKAERNVARDRENAG